MNAVLNVMMNSVNTADSVKIVQATMDGVIHVTAADIVQQSVNVKQAV